MIAFDLDTSTLPKHHTCTTFNLCRVGLKQGFNT